MKTFSSVEITGLGVKWEMLQNVHPDALGYLPEFLSVHDERPAAEQFAENYCGGWDSFKGFKLNPTSLGLSYPGDPIMYPIAIATLRDETVLVYDSAWVAVLQRDGAFDVARLD